MILSFKQQELRQLLSASVEGNDLAILDLRVKILHGLYKQSFPVKMVLDLMIEVLSLGIVYFTHMMEDTTKYLKEKASNSEIKLILESNNGPRPSSLHPLQTSRGTSHSNNSHLLMTKVKRSRSASDLLPLEIPQFNG